MRDARPILLIDDDAIDTMTVRRSFKDLRLNNSLAHAANGELALAHLHDNDNPRPCLILLDLNMPRMNGVEFMKTVKSDPDLRRIPIVVLTTSRDDRDIISSYRLNAAGYIIKPVDYQKFVEAIRIIDVYWTLSELPSDKRVTARATVATGV